MEVIHPLLFDRRSLLYHLRYKAKLTSEEDNMCCSRNRKLQIASQYVIVAWITLTAAETIIFLLQWRRKLRVESALFVPGLRKVGSNREWAILKLNEEAIQLSETHDHKNRAAGYLHVDLSVVPTRPEIHASKRSGLKSSRRGMSSRGRQTQDNSTACSKSRILSHCKQLAFQLGPRPRYCLNRMEAVLDTPCRAPTVVDPLEYRTWSPSQKREQMGAVVSRPHTAGPPGNANFVRGVGSDYLLENPMNNGYFQLRADFAAFLALNIAVSVEYSSHFLERLLSLVHGAGFHSVAPLHPAINYVCTEASETSRSCELDTFCGTASCAPPLFTDPFAAALRARGQEARERYGRHLHARLAPHRSYEQGVQCFRPNALQCKLDMYSQYDVNTASQFSSLRLEEIGPLLRVKVSLLLLPRFSASNAGKNCSSKDRLRTLVDYAVNATGILRALVTSLATEVGKRRFREPASKDLRTDSLEFGGLCDLKPRVCEEKWRRVISGIGCARTKEYVKLSEDCEASRAVVWHAAINSISWERALVLQFLRHPHRPTQDLSLRPSPIYDRERGCPACRRSTQVPHHHDRSGDDELLRLVGDFFRELSQSGKPAGVKYLPCARSADTPVPRRLAGCVDVSQAFVKETPLQKHHDDDEKYHEQSSCVEERLGKESAMPFVKETMKSRKSGWPDRESNPGTPKCDSSEACHSPPPPPPARSSRAAGTARAGRSFVAVLPQPVTSRMTQQSAASCNFALGSVERRSYEHETFNAALLRGDGGVVVRLLAPHLGEPGPVPGGVAPGFSHVSIVPGDAFSWRVFLRIPFPHPHHLIHSNPAPYLTSVGSQGLDVKSWQNLPISACHFGFSLIFLEKTSVRIETSTRRMAGCTNIFPDPRSNDPSFESGSKHVHGAGDILRARATYARLYHRGSKLDPRSDLRSTQKTVAPFEFRAELEIEMKFFSNRQFRRFEISIRDQQPSLVARAILSGAAVAWWIELTYIDWGRSGPVDRDISSGAAVGQWLERFPNVALVAQRIERFLVGPRVLVLYSMRTKSQEPYYITGFAPTCVESGGCCTPRLRRSTQLVSGRIYHCLLSRGESPSPLSIVYISASRGAVSLDSWLLVRIPAYCSQARTPSIAAVAVLISAQCERACSGDDEQENYKCHNPSLFIDEPLDLRVSALCRKVSTQPDKRIHPACYSFLVCTRRRNILGVERQGFRTNPFDSDLESNPNLIDITVQTFQIDTDAFNRSTAMMHETFAVHGTSEDRSSTLRRFSAGEGLGRGVHELLLPKGVLTSLSGGFPRNPSHQPSSKALLTAALFPPFLARPICLPSRHVRRIFIPAGADVLLASKNGSSTGVCTPAVYVRWVRLFTINPGCVRRSRVGGSTSSFVYGRDPGIWRDQAVLVDSPVSLLASHQDNPGSIPGWDTPDFRMWESCRIMPLVSGFSRGYPVSPTPSLRRCSIHTSITHIGSENLDSIFLSFIMHYSFPAETPSILPEIATGIGQGWEALIPKQHTEQGRGHLTPTFAFPVWWSELLTDVDIAHPHNSPETEDTIPRLTSAGVGSVSFKDHTHRSGQSRGYPPYQGTLQCSQYSLDHLLSHTSRSNTYSNFGSVCRPPVVQSVGVRETLGSNPGESLVAPYCPLRRAPKISSGDALVKVSLSDAGRVRQLEPQCRKTERYLTRIVRAAREMDLSSTAGCTIPTATGYLISIASSSLLPSRLLVCRSPYFDICVVFCAGEGEEMRITTLLIVKRCYAIDVHWVYSTPTKCTNSTRMRGRRGSTEMGRNRKQVRCKDSPGAEKPSTAKSLMFGAHSILRSLLTVKLALFNVIITGTPLYSLFKYPITGQRSFQIKSQLIGALHCRWGAKFQDLNCLPITVRVVNGLPAETATCALTLSRARGISEKWM
ncbi:hypothetical protein PR048_032362 [Dryococelus australis]|uniref:Uncharacterized protein n=1 Tax=Dryococelus australis TaxID=614101 RepID=A0ABQ9G657_9NEOP|nr:hypothetical protein PR048_032362 [Dryococelus australis]